MKLGEAMYKDMQSQQPGADGDAGPGGAAPGGTPGGEAGKKEDVVDAEFTEVDDDKKNNKKSA
jgi:molecular chaperone DnaK